MSIRENKIYEMPVSSADAELDALYAALTGRQPFRYRAEEDPLYRSYADRYVQNGRMAMRDTMGSAAALTGGYGSSYAQAAGQQQYDEYLRLLGEALPELYGMAYQQYLDEGAALRERYDLSYQRREDELSRRQAAEAAAYQRERDAISDERYRTEQASRAEQQRYQQQQDSYQKLVRLITGSGYTPSDAELAAAGMSRASADALRREYEQENGGQVAQNGYSRSSGSRKNSAKSLGTAPAGSISKNAGAAGSTVHESAAGVPWVSKDPGSYKTGLPKR